MLPQGADHFLNAPVLAASGAGLALVPTEATPDRIGAATARLLGEPSFAEAAPRMQSELLAMPPAASVLADQLAGVSSR